MNRLAWMTVVAASVTAALVELPAQTLLAQTPPPAAGSAEAPAAPAPIPDQVRRATSPETFRPQVEAFIKGHVARLGSSDSKAVSVSRDALVGETASPTTSAAYKDIYAQLLATHLSPVTDSSNPVTRFQAAVITARVALSSGNAQLSPVALKLLQDKNFAVQLYGLKAARAVIASQVVLPNGLSNSPLPNAVANTIVANADKAEIVRDGIDALYLDLDRAGRLTGPARTSALKELVPQAMKVLAARAKVYQGSVPEEMDSDRTVLTFFSNIAFPTLTNLQRQEVMQRFVDFLLSSAQAGTAATGIEQRNLGIHTIQVGRGLYIIASAMNTSNPTPQVKAFLDATQYFRTVSDTLVPPPATLQAEANKVFDAVRQIPEFAKIQTPQGDAGGK